VSAAGRDGPEADAEMRGAGVQSTPDVQLAARAARARASTEASELEACAATRVRLALE
jgi:hypothetical protein